MNTREFRKMLDAIKADVDEIENGAFDEEFANCVMLADSIINKAEKIRGFCRTMELAREVAMKSMDS